MKKWVYLFTEGNANMRELLGGKGANLAEMTNIGLPVPQGFTITTEACTQYYEDGREINEEIQGQINEYITKMEEITGKKFGDHENPLLVSVRSGARASMPGMMDTILNLGLNETVVNVIAEKSGNPRWAWDCYRRFIQMYSDVVMEVGKKYFETLIDEMKEKRGVTQDTELTADDLKGFDAAIDAFGAWTEDTLPQHSTSLKHLCDVLSGTETRLLVVGGAGSLYVNPEHTVCLADSPDFPDAFKPLAAAMARALGELRRREDVRWTYVSPAGDFRADGERTGRYILGGEELTLNSKGESTVSYADYAVAMVDEAEKGTHIRQRISVVAE
mgnify:CR=1 FL=1